MIVISDDALTPSPAVKRFFDDTALPALTISISESEWNNLLEAYDKDNHTHEYVKCRTVTLERDGGTLKCADAGLRLRGNTSRRRPEGHSGDKHSQGDVRWRRVHYGLHLHKFNEGGNLAGIRRINLKYAKEDPTYIREHFCYDLLTRYGVWTAPQSSWCRLSLRVGDSPAVYMGVYMMTESIDRQYVRNRPLFGADDGFLWKCNWGANLRDTDSRLFHLDDDSSKEYVYDLKSDDAADLVPATAQLKDFISNLQHLKGDSFRNWISRVCDVDLLLKMYAANVALGHWDDYWNNKNNFYLYFNSRDPFNYKVYMLPYDYDNTLGTSHNCGVQHDSGRQDPYRWGIDECILISKILQVAEFRDIYTQYLRDFSTVDNPWTGVSQSAERIRQWQTLLAPYVPNDTGEDMEIRDRPASWGNHSEYRLLSDDSKNWFRVKAGSISSYLK